MMDMIFCVQIYSFWPLVMWLLLQLFCLPLLWNESYVLWLSQDNCSHSHSHTLIVVTGCTLHASHKCSLLLQMFHTAWSVCLCLVPLSVLYMLNSCAKTANRSRYYLGEAGSWEPRNHVLGFQSWKVLEFGLGLWKSLKTTSLFWAFFNCVLQRKVCLLNCFSHHLPLTSVTCAIYVKGMLGVRLFKCSLLYWKQCDGITVQVPCWMLPSDYCCIVQK